MSIGRYPTISFSSLQTKATKVDINERLFIQKGVLIWHVGGIKNGRLDLTECRVYTDSKGERILLPVSDDPLNFHQKIEQPDKDGDEKTFPYVILSNDKYPLSTIPCKSRSKKPIPKKTKTLPSEPKKSPVPTIKPRLYTLLCPSWLKHLHILLLYARRLKDFLVNGSLKRTTTPHAHYFTMTKKNFMVSY